MVDRVRFQILARETPFTIPQETQASVSICVLAIALNLVLAMLPHLPTIQTQEADYLMVLTVPWVRVAVEPFESLSLAATYVHSYNQSNTGTGTVRSNFQAQTEDCFGRVSSFN